MTSCEPCQRKGNHVSAVKWCTECDEPLCSTCYDSHLSMKALMTHRVVDVESAKSPPVSALAKTSTQFCKKHQGLKFEYHCVFHDTISCQTCMTQQHRACSKVIPIDIAAKGSKTSKSTNELLSQLDCIDKNLENFRQKKLQNIQQIEDQDKSIKSSVGRLRQKVISRLDTIEKELYDELYGLKKTGRAKLEREARKIQQSQNLVKSHKEQIEFEKYNGSDKQAFILANITREHLIEIEEKIFRMKAHSGAISVVFRENDDIIESVGKLGSVTLTSDSNTAATKDQQKDTSERNETFIQGFDYSFHFDASSNADVMITGMATTDDDRLLLCGGGKFNIIVCTCEGKYLQNCKLPAEPWDVAVTRDRNGIAVTTLPYLYAIQFINMNSMAAGKMVKFDWRVYGIATIQNKIVVGGKNSLQILNTDGIKMSEVVVPSINVFYIHPRENGNFYYSDCTYVYCMKPDGRHVFCQNVSNLDSPRNIVTDNRGNLYVAGHRSENVHRLSSDGIALDVPLSKGDGIQSPFAICFSADHRKFFVSNKNGKTISVYESRFASYEKEKDIQNLLQYL